jgi:hypothetical protein
MVLLWIDRERRASPSAPGAVSASEVNRASTIAYAERELATLLLPIQNDLHSLLADEASPMSAKTAQALARLQQTFGSIGTFAAIRSRLEDPRLGDAAERIRKVLEETPGVSLSAPIPAAPKLLLVKLERGDDVARPLAVQHPWHPLGAVHVALCAFGGRVHVDADRSYVIVPARRE